ncbi:MAG TPA: hypothetical protein VIJ18_18130 [Microbacteriaceae bacterium]
MKCQAKTIAGKPCNAYAIHGGTVCRKHGGSARQVRAKAAVRAEVAQWTLGDATDDPGETLLRLLTQARVRADGYAMEIQQTLTEYPTLRQALVADAYGEFGKTGEYIRGLVRLEAEERDRIANFATKALNAGLAERQVRLAERQGELLALVVTKIIDSSALGLSAAQKQLMPQVMRETLVLATAGTLRKDSPR